MIYAPMQSASDADAVWFILHPGRTIRIRAYVEGELLASVPHGDGIPMVLVRQLQPGVRARVPVYVQKLPANTEKACLAVLRQVLRNQASGRSGRL